MVSLQLPVERRTMKARRPRTDVLPTVLRNQPHDRNPIGTGEMRSLYRCCQTVCCSVVHSINRPSFIIPADPITRNTFCGTWYLPHSRVHKSIAELCSNFGDSDITKGQIAYFSLRMRKTALYLLPVKNLTSLSWTPISYNTREFWRYVYI